MHIAINTSITVWLIASAVTLMGQDSQTRLSTARQLLANYTERVRWQHYWLPATVSNSYVSGAEVQVRALFARSAAGFCAPTLEICQIYERDAKGNFSFLTEWQAERNQSETSLPARFAVEYAHGKEVRPIQGPGPAHSPKEQRTFDVTKLVEPLRSPQSLEAFDSALTLSWKLLGLIAPKSISARIVPSDSDFLRVEVLTTAERYRKGCGAGQVIIPFYSSQDPRVFVYVDLGGHCEKGVMEFVKTPNGTWSFDLFVVREMDVKNLVPRIQNARMESLRLPG